MTLKLQTDSILLPEMRSTKLPQNESLLCLVDFQGIFKDFHFICWRLRSKYPCIKDGKRCQNGVQFVAAPIFDRL